MRVSEKLFEKTFQGKTTKEAFLTCCKWVSTNIIAVNNSQNITYDITKAKNPLHHKVTLTVYITADESEIFRHTCEVCNETSGLFYLSGQKYKCDSCKINPYRDRMKSRLEALKDGMKGSIKK